MEHASIAAFSHLSLHRSALGAPAHLLASTHRAALDEIRHAEATYAIARALAGTAHTAGPIPDLATAPPPGMDLTRLAIGSLVDGCLGEGIAADVAAHGARIATEPTIARTLTTIAADEATHAELAWDILAWTLTHAAGATAAVAARVERLTDELTPQLPAVPHCDPAVLAAHGVLDQATLGRLAAARIAAVQDRVRALLGPIRNRVRLVA